jgi:hypothetical protein
MELLLLVMALIVSGMLLGMSYAISIFINQTENEMIEARTGYYDANYRNAEVGSHAQEHSVSCPACGSLNLEFVAVNSWGASVYNCRDCGCPTEVPPKN